MEKKKEIPAGGIYMTQEARECLIRIVRRHLPEVRAMEAKEAAEKAAKEAAIKQMDTEHMDGKDEVGA